MLPLSVTAWIVYSVALPARVNCSAITGAEVNPSVINTAPDVDWEAPLTKGVPRWFNVVVVWQSRVTLSSSPNFSNVYTVDPFKDRLAIQIKCSLRTAIDW